MRCLRTARDGSVYMADIFISYRRKGGEVLAQLINENLIKKKYSVFYDIESLSSELFDERLFAEIESCTDFILILPEGALDRSIEDEDDWVRREIRHAIKHEKHIIPIFMRGFEFPNNLPEDIQDVRRYNGIQFQTMDLFEAKIYRLCGYLQSKPRGFSSAVGAFFEKAKGATELIFKPIAWVGGHVWRFAVLRFAFILLAVYFLLIGTIDVVTEAKRHGKHIQIDALYQEGYTPYIKNIAISEDYAQLAHYNGDGKLYIYQLAEEGSLETYGTIAEYQSSFGKESVIAMYNYMEGTCWLYNLETNELEIFYTRETSGKDNSKPTKKITFAKSEGHLHLEQIGAEQESGNYVIFWAGEEKSVVAVYSENGGEPQSSFEIKGKHLISNTKGSRYYVFINDEINRNELKDNVSILDAKEMRWVDNACEVLKKCAADKILTDDFDCFDASQRYFLSAYAKKSDKENEKGDTTFYDIVIWDVQSERYVDSKTLADIGLLGIKSDGTYYVKGRSAEEQPLGIYRGNFLPEKAEKPKMILSDAEFSDKHNGLTLDDCCLDMIYDTDVLIAYGAFTRSEIHLIDLGTKECIASNTRDIKLGGNYVEIEQSGKYVFLNVRRAIGEGEYDNEFFSYYFSYKNENGEIVFRGSDKSIFETKDFWYGPIGFAVIALLLIAGYNEDKKRKA